MSHPEASDFEQTAETALAERRPVLNIRDTIRQIGLFGRRHSVTFFGGAIAAVGIVAMRLALPWPLRTVVEFAVENEGMTAIAAAPGDKVLGLLLLFLGLAVLLGLFDYLARLSFSRFSIATTRDLRQAVFARSLGIDAANCGIAAGDLVSRLIGDAARVKAGMQGFLLHVATNGLLFVGVTIVLLTIEPGMAMLFGVAACTAGLITIWGARRILERSFQHRQKEGRLANKIHSSLNSARKSAKLKRINKESGQYAVSLTRMQGQITSVVHLVFGVTVIGALWIGIQALGRGSIVAGDLVLFLFYVLMIRGPMVRLARQGTRTGKILGPAHRLVQMLQPHAGLANGDATLKLRRLKKAFKIVVDKTALQADSETSSSSLGSLELTVRRGESVAIVDESGHGLKSIAEIIGGLKIGSGCDVTWDTVTLTQANVAALRRQLSVFRPVSSPATANLAARLRELVIASRRRASVYVWLEPDADLTRNEASQVLTTLASTNFDNSPTTIVTTSRSVGLDNYDRIVHLRKNTIVFDGNAKEWRGLHDTPRVEAIDSRRERETDSALKILFSGYAPVHFRCFAPLYHRLTNWPGVSVRLSGGLRHGPKGQFEYDEAAMYDGFDLPEGSVLSVEAIQDMDFDVQFSAHTKLILPRKVDRRIQIFHGVSFRNKSIRPENMGCDHYFVVGPYMLSRFVQAGLMQDDDPRVVRTGFMKTDPLLDGTLDRQAILEQLEFDGTRPVVLYAPTGAKRNSLETMGEETIRRILQDDQYDLVIKPHDHPKNKDVNWDIDLERYAGTHCRIVPPYDDVIPMLFVADLLISDASSVANEFTLLDRPIIYLDTPGLLEKAADADHSMLDLVTYGRAGGVVARHPNEVTELIKDSLTNSNKLSPKRREISENLFYNRGCATATAMSWLESAILPRNVIDKESYHETATG